MCVVEFDLFIFWRIFEKFKKEGWLEICEICFKIIWIVEDFNGEFIIVLWFVLVIFMLVKSLDGVI